MGERNVWGKRLGAPMQLPVSYVRASHARLRLHRARRARPQCRHQPHRERRRLRPRQAVRADDPRPRLRHRLLVTRALAPDAETGETFDAAARVPEAVLADVVANVREDRSATAEQAHAEAAANSTMTHRPDGRGHPVGQRRPHRGSVGPPRRPGAAHCGTSARSSPPTTVRVGGPTAAHRRTRRPRSPTKCVLRRSVRGACTTPTRWLRCSTSDSSSPSGVGVVRRQGTCRARLDTGIDDDG